MMARFIASLVIALVLLVAPNAMAHGDFSIPDMADLQLYPARLDLDPNSQFNDEDVVRQFLISQNPREDILGDIYIDGACLKKQQDGSYRILPLPSPETSPAPTADHVLVSPQQEGVLFISIERGDYRVARVICGDERERVPLTTLAPESENPIASGERICNAFITPRQEVCIVEGPFCDREPLRRTQWGSDHNLYCYPPDDRDATFTVDPRLRQILGLATLHPRRLGELGAPVTRTNKFIAKTLFLPDDRMIALVSIGVSGLSPSTQQPVSASAFNIISWTPEGGATMLHDDLILSGEVMAYDATLDALFVGPVEGIEFDARTFSIPGSGGNPGSSSGQFVGLGFHVVPLGEEERGFSGVLSLTELLIARFPEAGWLPGTVNDLRFEATKTGALHMIWEQIRYTFILDYDALDLDYDTLTRAEEVALGTSDYRADSDGDAVLDHIERRLFGTDPTDPTDGPPSPDIPYFSKSSFQGCRAYPATSLTPTRSRIRVEETTVWLQRDDHEWVQMGEDRILEKHKGVPFVGPEDSLLIMTRWEDTPNQLVHVDSEQNERVIFTRADLLALLDNRDDGGIGSRDRSPRTKAVWRGLRGLGWHGESGMFLMDVRTTGGYYLLGVRLDGEVVTISNAMLQGGIGSGLAQSFERPRFSFPVLEYSTGLEYVYEWGAITPWFTQPRSTSMGRFGDHKPNPLTGITPKLSSGEYGRARSMIEPGDTLLLVQVGNQAGGLKLDVTEALRPSAYMLFKFDRRGFRAPIWPQALPFVRVTGMGLSADGALCVADYGAGKLREYVSPNQLELRPSTPDSVGDVPGIVDCAYDGKYLYTLADQAPHILRFDRETNEVTEVSDVMVGEFPSQLSVHDGTLLVADKTSGPRTFRGDGTIVSLDQQYRVVHSNRTHTPFTSLFFKRQSDDTLPDALPVQLAERADGLIVGFGINTPGRDVVSLDDKLAPNRVALYDLATDQQSPLTGDFNLWAVADQWEAGAIEVVPGLPVHPCTGEEIRRGESPIILPPGGPQEQPQEADAPRPPRNGEPIQGAAPASGSGGCTHTPTCPAHPSGWLVMVLLFLCGKESRRRLKTLPCFRRCRPLHLRRGRDLRCRRRSVWGSWRCVRSRRPGR